MVRKINILQARLFNSGLLNSPFKDAAAVVTRLGAVQAQEFSLSRWSLGLRIKNSTEDAIGKSYDDGSILRVHVMRPTWHFILPEDIGWMTALTGPRIKAGLAGINRRLELDEKLIAKTNNIIVKALQGQNYLTRQQLKQILEAEKVTTTVQRLAHIIMFTELAGLVCSGPRRGKQLTYALTAERVKKPRELDREEGMAVLARRYFDSHGPAQLEDFTWWSGLSAREARQALDSAKSGLAAVKINEREYWYAGSLPQTPPALPAALLLPIYDEYIIAYKDRRDISGVRSIEAMMQAGNTYTGVLVVDGKVAGSWKKNNIKDVVEIKLNPFNLLTGEQMAAVEGEKTRYSAFSGQPVKLLA